MKAEIFKDFLLKWNSELISKRKKIVLLLYNFSGHQIPDGLTNIRVIFFVPNVAAHVQPLDAGIISCFKAIFRRIFCLSFQNRLPGRT